MVIGKAAIGTAEDPPFLKADMGGSAGGTITEHSYSLLTGKAPKIRAFQNLPLIIYL
jgi:hypothetical protein